MHKSALESEVPLSQIWRGENVWEAKMAYATMNDVAGAAHLAGHT